MKKALSFFSILLLLSIFCSSCGGSKKNPETPSDQPDTEAVDTDTNTDPADSATDADTDSGSECGNKITEVGEICDGDAKECSEIDPAFTGGYAVCETDCSGWNMTGCHSNQDPVDNSGVFDMGPYTVDTTDIAAGTDGAPRDFRLYEPSGAEGKIPVIHFQHGFTYKDYYYDDIIIHLASHGFIVISSQSNHGTAGIGGDTTTVEADKVISLINWLKENLQSKISVTADFENFGLSGHSRGGKVSNRILNKKPEIAKGFFGVDPVDSGSPVDNSDPLSLNDPVQFKGESFFLGTELGPEGGMMACAPEGENSTTFYERFPAPSHHIIAAGVGHADMVDPDDISACGLNCSVCKSSGSSELNQQLIHYIGGLMVAFFNFTLKGQSQYENLLNDSSTHPFPTAVVEHKNPGETQEDEIEIGEPLGEVTVSNKPNGFDGIFFDGPGEDEVFIFYPGASIDPSAYSSIMTMLAERGIDGFVIKMPADMAVLGQNKADDVYSNYPNYKKHYLGGHSLGGSMIANYAAKNLDRTNGLFLFAAFPTDSMLNAQFPILFIYGSNDGVLNKNMLQNSLSKVPAEYSVVYEIEGGNHAYFGDYGKQTGDGNATITPLTQQKITVREILKLIR